MKILALGDALLPTKFVEEGVSGFQKYNAEVVTLRWGEDDQKAIDKRAIALEKNGPTADEPPDEIYDYIETADVLMVHYCPVSEKLLQKAKNLKILGTFRAGTENIDLDYATANGILAFHVIGRTTEAVSDFTVGLLLCEIRNIARAHMAMVGGNWRKEFSNTATTPELENKTLGIVGFGQIGRAILRKMSGFNMKFIVYDPFVKAEAISELGGEKVEMEDILRESDFISLHLRMEKGEKPIIGEEELRKMKPTAYLINSARAYAVDQDALYRALRDGMISGAALDTFYPEPLPLDHPLLSLDNVTLTPHLASSTLECMAKSPRLLTNEIIKFFESGSSRFILNPQVLKDNPVGNYQLAKG